MLRITKLRFRNLVMILRGLKKVIMERGIGCTELSRLSGIHINTIRNYLTGNTDPAVTKAKQIAESLSLSLDYIWGDDDTVLQLSNAKIIKLELARDILSSYDRLPPFRFREYLEDKIKQYRGS